MTGILLSDSTSILSTHHRSARENSSAAHPDYHSHSSHPCLRQAPLSSFSILPSLPSHPSPSTSTLREMSDRPTLPGIASLLALAGQHRSPVLPSPSASHAHPTCSPPSSGPVPHAHPASNDMTPFSKTECVNHPSSPTSREPAIHLRHQGHRRRSSSITIVDAEKRSLPHPNRVPPNPLHLQHILSSNCPPSSKCFSSTSPPSSKYLSCASYPIPPPPSFHKICHDSIHPCGNDTYASASDRGVGSLRHCEPRVSPHDIANQPPNRHDDTLRRRHSDRIRTSLSRPVHHTSSRHNTPPPPQQSLVAHRPPHHTRTHSFTNAPLSPAHVHEQDDRHVRRRSNASVSSSSSISGSASLSSDFGTSLNIAPQAQVHFRGGHATPSSASVSSMLSSCQDRSRPQFLKAERSWPNEEGGYDHGWNSPCSTVEDQRSYDCSRLWDPHEGPSHHHISSVTGTSTFDSHSQMSVSPEIAASSRMSGQTISNNASCPQNHRYQCMEVGCGKTFSRPSSLKIHSYSHTGQKPFKCMRCDRAFSVQSNLKRHQKVHEKRSIAVYSRGISTSGNATSLMMYESGSGRLIEEQSGEEDGDHDRMEE